MEQKALMHDFMWVLQHSSPSGAEVPKFGYPILSNKRTPANKRIGSHFLVSTLYAY